MFAKHILDTFVEKFESKFSDDLKSKHICLLLKGKKGFV